jgi:hypothetical protein
MMKKSIVGISLMFTFFSLSAGAYNGFNPDQASSDIISKHMNSEEFQRPLTKSKLIGLPQAVVCDNGAKIVFAEMIPEFQYSPGVYLSDLSPDAILVNGNDGDQVSMIRIKLSELRAMSKGRISSTLALTATGFWWADGDHITGGTTTCVLAQSRTAKSSGI